jgi:2,3,4,5-tetrahydropyridine-2-carboxylate N-succinyltransferase
MTTTRETIEAAFSGAIPAEDARAAVDEALGLLDRGEARLAEPGPDGWTVNGWLQQAILLHFRLQQMEVIEHGPFTYHDKIPLKGIDALQGVRVVPPATVRRGAFVEAGAVLMPSYVNIGSYVGSGTMIDTWATVGSGAQVGRDVHVAGGVGIGGVLEPPGARPVIIEDGAFLGSRCIITEGVIVEREAVIGPNVALSASVPVIDVTGPEPVEHRGRVPARAIVVPGTRPKTFPAGTYQLACALVIGYRTESTDRKTSLNAALRDHGIAV